MDSPLPFDAPGQEVLLIFRAGKMIFQGAQVQADTRKGLVRILRGDEGLIHFQWLDRTTDLVEDDQIVFPDEAVFEKVQQSSGRVYILKFKHDDRKYFFWMQEPRADGDDQLCNSVNLIMNCPPDDEEEELSPDSILQTDQISRDTYPGTSMEGSAAATVGGTQAVQLSDLQRILTNIGQTYGATELSHALMRDTGPSFSEILKPDIVLPLLENCHLEERLGPFLPEGRWTPGAIAELMQSPQFHQQLEAFTHVLRSGQIDLSQFGIDPSKCDFTVASFLEAIEDQVVEKQENAVVKADTKPANESGSAVQLNTLWKHIQRSLKSHSLLNYKTLVRSEEEVQQVVKLCQKYKVPIVPYGGATSLEGHILAPYGGVSIDMNLMKRVKELHVEDMDVVVEPGIGWMELNEILKPHGLFFPLDPGPGATIGGMCATRCSGSLAVRYGTMRDNVIAMKAVLASGDLVKTASRARKSAAGYDLTRLMIGSEGTLGVITEVTLRLQKIPEASIVAMCNFPSVTDAANVAIETMHSGIQVSRVELLDEVMMKAINLANGRHYPEETTLMFEFIGTEAYALEQARRVKAIVEANHGSDFIFSNTSEEKEDLWKVRKEAYWSCQALKPGAEAMVTDVCVPLSRLAQCISESKALLDSSPLYCCIISHAGDGNFHVAILFDSENKAEVDEAQKLANHITHIALSMEGTCTGEHGVGVGKMKYLEEELGAEALVAMGRIKTALDPERIMNPGKIIPPQFCF